MAQYGSAWVAEPIRHPFQLSSTAYPPTNTSNTPLHPNSHTNMPSPPATATASASAPVQSSNNHSERRPPTRTFIPSRMSYKGSHIRSWISRNKILSLFIVLPLPTALCVLYIVVGHAIFRASQHSSGSQSYHDVPLSSSAKAGAVGGAILTLPIAFVLYLIQRITVEPSSSRSGPADDFFDDESDVGAADTWRGLIAYVLAVIVVVFEGVIAGPIGISILRSTSSTPCLSAAQGSLVCVVGGLIFVPLIIGLCVVV
jgi:hypothetical protein